MNRSRHAIATAVASILLAAAGPCARVLAAPPVQWSPWMTIAGDQQYGADVSFKISYCAGQNLVGYSYVRFRNRMASPLKGALRFNHTDCDGVVRSSTAYFNMAPGAVDQNGGNWFLGREVSNVRLTIDPSTPLQRLPQHLEPRADLVAHYQSLVASWRAQIAQLAAHAPELPAGATISEYNDEMALARKRVADFERWFDQYMNNATTDLVQQLNDASRDIQIHLSRASSIYDDFHAEAERREKRVVAERQAAARREAIDRAAREREEANSRIASEAIRRAEGSQAQQQAVLDLAGKLGETFVKPDAEADDEEVIEADESESQSGSLESRLSRAESRLAAARLRERQADSRAQQARGATIGTAAGGLIGSLLGRPTSEASAQAAQQLVERNEERAKAEAELDAARAERRRKSAEVDRLRSLVAESHRAKSLDAQPNGSPAQPPAGGVVRSDVGNMDSAPTDPETAFRNAMAYATGDGVGQDDGAAASWCRKAADLGFAPAQHNLGVMYQSGRGVDKDDGAAARWYQKAAEQGFAPAQYNLGVMFQSGLGVASNEAAAAGWYRKAAEQGHADAQYSLGWMYQSGVGVAKNQAAATGWYRKAAEQGHGDAQFQLGVRCEFGLGVAKDESAAVGWYRKAAEQGVAGAAKELDRLRSRLVR